jgi:tripartite-type tricarboxylate transporter receptor subunit TctC
MPDTDTPYRRDKEADRRTPPKRCHGPIVAALASVALLFAWSWGAIALAQAYPTKPVKLIIPFPPASPGDIIGRIMAQKLSEALGQQFVVDNRAGASGTIGTEAAVKAAADGYTLLLGSTGTLATAPSLYPNLGYDPSKSFAPISLLSSASFLVVVNASVPANSLKELIDLAKSRPGQLNYGSGGNGHPMHIAGEMFKAAAGVDIVHVPYKGQSPAGNDLVAGRIQIVFDQIVAYQSQIRSGKLKALAVAKSARIPQLPDVPTTAEAGLPGFEVSAWFGLLAPRGTPSEVISRLNGEVLKALTTKDLRDTLSNLGLEPAGCSPEQFAAVIVDDGAKWSRAVKASGARLD